METANVLWYVQHYKYHNPEDD